MRTATHSSTDRENVAELISSAILNAQTQGRDMEVAAVKAATAYAAGMEAFKQASQQPNADTQQ